MQNYHIGLALYFLLLCNLNGQVPAVDTLVKKAINMRTEGNFDASKAYAEQGLKIAKGNKPIYRKGIADSYVEIGTYHKNYSEQFDSAHIVYDIALNEYQNILKDTLGTGKVLNLLIDLYLKENELASALRKSKEAFRWLKPARNAESILAKVYNNTANLYERLGKIDTAIMMNKESIGLLPKTQDSLIWAQANYGLAKRYYFKNKVQLAKRHARTAIDYFDRAKANYNKVDALNLIGMSYRGQQADSARYYLNEAKKLGRIDGDNAMLSYAFYNLATIENDESKYKKALMYLDSAYHYYQLLDKNNLNWQSQFSEDYLANIYQTEISIKNTLENKQLKVLILLVVLLFLMIFGFILFINKTKSKLLKAQNKISETSRELLEKKNRILKTNNDKLLDEKRNLYLLNEKEIRLNAFQEERERIGRGLHDQVSSRLTVIKWNLEVFLKTISNALPEAKTQVNSVIESTQETYKEVYRLYYDLMRTSSAWVMSIKGYPAQIHKLIETVQFNIEEGIEKKIPAHIGNEVEIIVIELTTNVVKHANAKSLYVDLYLAEQTLMLSVQDDGLGFELDQTTNRSGLDNIQFRLSKMNGKLDIDSSKGNGTIITIEIPIYDQ